MADIRIRIAVIALCVIGLLGGGIGMMVAKHSTATPITITVPNADQTTSSDPLPLVTPNTPGVTEASKTAKTPIPATPTPVPPGGMYVDVSGAVRHPSLYQIPPGSRVMHAVHAAGGAISKADLDAVNLAEPVKDGEKVYIPFKSERMRSVASAVPAPTLSPMPRHARTRTRVSILPLPVPTSMPMPMHIRPITYTPAVPGNTINNGNQKFMLRASQTPISQTPSSPIAVSEPTEQLVPVTTKLKSPEEGKININVASPEELARLPGIGPAMAGRIIEYRSHAGSFENFNDLKQVKGIGDKKIAKIAPFITF